MAEGSLIDEIQPWLDPELKMCRGANYGTDNYAKDEAILLTLLSADERKNRKAIFDRFHSICQVKPGVYIKKPGCFDHNSVDNLTGSIVGSVLHGADIHTKIFEHGRTHNWTYSVTKPDLTFRLPTAPFQWGDRQDWFGRFFGTVAAIKLSVGAELSYWDQQWMAYSSKKTASTEKGNTTDKVLLYLLLKVPGWEKYPRIQKGIAEAKTALSHTYPNGWKGVFNIYYTKAYQAAFGSTELHPFEEHAPGAF